MRKVISLVTTDGLDQWGNCEMPKLIKDTPYHVTREEQVPYGSFIFTLYELLETGPNFFYNKTFFADAPVSVEEMIETAISICERCAVAKALI